MKWYILALLWLLVLVPVSHCLQDWWDWWRTSYYGRKKLIQIESQIMYDLEQKVSTMQDIRFMYEESPFYEIGYVIAEVLERYRKMVDTVYRVNSYADPLFHTLRYLQQQQNYYQECYELVMMLHEIPRKYAHDDEFRPLLEAVQTGNVSMISESFESQKERWDALSKERKKSDRQKRARAKQLKKAQELDMIINNMHVADADVDKNYVGPPTSRGINTLLDMNSIKRAPRKPIVAPDMVTPKGWQDYGWEPNYDWWS